MPSILDGPVELEATDADLGTRRQPLTAVDAAWLSAVPVTVLVLVAMLTLGRLLGDMLQPAHTGYRFLPFYQAGARREPAEQGRFLLALTAPALLFIATIGLTRRQPRLSPGVRTSAVVSVQAILGGVLAACIIDQYQARYDWHYTGLPVPTGWRYFTPGTLVAGGTIALALFAGLRSRAITRRSVAWLRESRILLLAAGGAAAALTVMWLLPGLNSDHSIVRAGWSVRYHLAFILDEEFAFLNGRTPIVNFSAQYASLWPWIAGLPMLAFGKTLLIFTITTCSITALALLTVFDVLRRATRSAIAALVLYLPFLATSLFCIRGTMHNRENFGTYFAAFPLRYAGPYLLLWSVVRHLCATERSRVGRCDGARQWLIFTAAGLVVLNNVDYGVPALGASVAAIALMETQGRKSALRLATAVISGLSTALVLVTALTVWRTGSAPHLWRLTDYARLYAGAAFASLPITPAVGLHTAIYLTYVGAIATATVRALGGAPNRVVTGALAWCGVFGLGAGAYFVGRSHPEALIASFSAWALTVALLTVVAAQSIALRRNGHLTLAMLMVLFAFGLSACSLAQTPQPWSQLQRLQAYHSDGTPMVPPRDLATRRFISSLADGPSKFVVKRGAPVAILTTLGHRMADAYGVVNVSPYTGWYSLFTEERVEAVLRALDRAGGNTVIVPANADPVLFRVLVHHGFKVLTRTGQLDQPNPHHAIDAATVLWQERADSRQPSSLTKWVDTHHLRPRALR